MNSNFVNSNAFEFNLNPLCVCHCLVLIGVSVHSFAIMEWNGMEQMIENDSFAPSEADQGDKEKGVLIDVFSNQKEQLPNRVAVNQKFYSHQFGTDLL